MIGYHLVRLAKFSGRETRARFWPWAGVVAGLLFVGTFAAMLPHVFRSIAKMRRFAREHPDQATVTSGPGHYEIRIEGHHPELMPDMGPFVAVMEATLAVAVVLLAAAIVRRLHDTGRSGAWGLLPLPFLFLGFAIIPSIFSAPVPDMRMFGLLFVNNMLYLGTLGALILLLARPGAVDENRYGQAPGA